MLHCTDIPPSVHSLVHRHLGCSTFLAVRSTVALTAFVSSRFISLGYLLGSEISRSWENCLILRTCHTVCQSGCTIVHSHPQCTRVLVFHILISTCYYPFDWVILMGVKGHLCGFGVYLPTDWWCWSNVFCVLTSYLYFLFEKKVYSNPLPIFKLDYLSYYWFLEFFILNTGSLLDPQFVGIFSHSVGWLFILFIVSFDAQRLLVSKSSLPVFFFFFCCLCFWYHV